MPTPPIWGLRTSHPGPVRVCVCISAALCQRVCEACFAAPHLSFVPFSFFIAHPLPGSVCPFLVLFLAFFLFVVFFLSLVSLLLAPPPSLAFCGFGLRVSPALALCGFLPPLLFFLLFPLFSGCLWFLLWASAPLVCCLFPPTPSALFFISLFPAFCGSPPPPPASVFVLWVCSPCCSVLLVPRLCCACFLGVWLLPSGCCPLLLCLPPLPLVFVLRVLSPCGSVFRVFSSAFLALPAWLTLVGGFCRLLPPPSPPWCVCCALCCLVLPRCAGLLCRFLRCPVAVFCAACCAFVSCLVFLWAAARCAVLFGAAFCVLCAVPCCWFVMVSLANCPASQKILKDDKHLRRIFKRGTKSNAIHHWKATTFFKDIQKSYTYRSQQLASRCFIYIRTLQCTIALLCACCAAADRNHNTTHPCDLELVSPTLLAPHCRSLGEQRQKKSFWTLRCAGFLKHNSGPDPTTWVERREHLSSAPIHTPCSTLPLCLRRSCRSFASVLLYPQQLSGLFEIP